MTTDLIARAERDRLREALQWYADAKNYELDEDNDLGVFPIFADAGKRARNALGKGDGG
jgi:hypothetical protein